MKTDIMIIGQGICGTFLSWNLQKAGLSTVVIDESRPFTASKVAAGIINPVTGRRMVKTWMIDELLPFVPKEYRMIGNELGISCISQKNIIDFFPTPQAQAAFSSRQDEGGPFLRRLSDGADWKETFYYDFGYGEIESCWLIDLGSVLAAYREKIVQQGQLMEEAFDLEQLVITENKVEYKGIQADRIIFCDGMSGFRNPYFKNLPFAPNKGEVLIVEIKDMPSEYIFKRGISIVRWKGDHFWVGSSYQWEFTDDRPTQSFRDRTEAILHEWLRLPYKTISHLASVRPATLERRPFVGFHPGCQQIGILNGMGAKGCSLAPYFARQLTEHLTKNATLNPEADIVRFTRLLRR